MIKSTKATKKRYQNMNYAQNIKNLREDNDLYQKDIAKLLGTTQP